MEKFKFDKKKLPLYVAGALVVLVILVSMFSQSAEAASLARATDPSGSGRYLDVTDELGECPTNTYVARMHEPDGALVAQGCWTISLDAEGLPVSVDVIYDGYEDAGALSYPFEDFVALPDGG